MTVEALVPKEVTGNPRTDAYPSRNGQPARLLPRLNPVVHTRDRSRGPLSPDQVAQYESEGFTILERVFNVAEVRLLQEEQERLQNEPQRDDETRINEPGGRDLRSVFAIHSSSKLFARLASDSRLVDMARYLLDDEVYIHQSRLNYKPGFRGREFYWHSDFETWHVEDGMPGMRALSMSITLSENTADNGPLLLIPGSHMHYVVCEGQTPEQHFRHSLRSQEYGTPADALLAQLVRKGGIVAADAQPGSVILFDCNTMHGSNGNITPHPRSNAFFVYNAMSNRVGAPYCDQAPRPEFVCTRKPVEPIQRREGALGGG